MSTGGSGTITAGTGTPDIPNVNPTNVDASYGTTNPVVYAIQAYGGFSTTQAFARITRLAETIITQFDTTGALEVLFDVSFFNTQIGIVKDSSNINVLTPTTSYYDMSQNMLLTDSITLTAKQFVAGLQNRYTNVVDVGVFRSIYTDFANYVAKYFGFSNVGSMTEDGFATLFSNPADFLPNSGVFDPSAFLSIIVAKPNTGDGAYVTDLSGQLVIGGITQLLRNAVDANPFGNRNPQTGTTAGDPHDRANYGVTDGFFADDLIFVPTNGMTITLNLGVDSEYYPTPQNNPATGANPETVNTSSTTNYTAGSTTTTITKQQVTALTNISQTVTAPLLIRMANASNMAALH